MRAALAHIMFVGFAASLSAQDAIGLRHHDGWVSSVAFSADSRYLATASADRTVRIHDLTKAKPDRVLSGYSDIVSAVAFSPKEELIATACFDGKISLERLDRFGKIVLQSQRGSILSLAFSTDGNSLATGAMDGKLMVFDSWTGRPDFSFLMMKGHKNWVNALVFNKDGILASASSDNTVQLWRGGADSFARFDFLEGEVRSLAFSPDGKTLVAGVRYGTIKIIDVPTKKVATHKSHAADVWAVAFSPDGKSLASGDGAWDRPGEVRLWDTTTWKEKKLLKTTGEVLSLAYSPDGRYLAAGCWDKSVHLWRMDKRPER